MTIMTCLRSKAYNIGIYCNSRLSFCRRPLKINTKSVQMQINNCIKAVRVLQYVIGP